MKTKYKKLTYLFALILLSLTTYTFVNSQEDKNPEFLPMVVEQKIKDSPYTVITESFYVLTEDSALNESQRIYSSSDIYINNSSGITWGNIKATQEDIKTNESFINTVNKSFYGDHDFGIFFRLNNIEGDGPQNEIALNNFKEYLNKWVILYKKDEFSDLLRQENYALLSERPVNVFSFTEYEDRMDMTGVDRYEFRAKIKQEDIYEYINSFGLRDVLLTSPATEIMADIANVSNRDLDVITTTRKNSNGTYEIKNYISFDREIEEGKKVYYIYAQSISSADQITVTSFDRPTEYVDYYSFENDIKEKIKNSTPVEKEPVDDKPSSGGGGGTSIGPSCNTLFDGTTRSNLLGASNLCSSGTISNFQRVDYGWTWICTKPEYFNVRCSANKSGGTVAPPPVDDPYTVNVGYYESMDLELSQEYTFVYSGEGSEMNLQVYGANVLQSFIMGGQLVLIPTGSGWNCSGDYCEGPEGHSFEFYNYEPSTFTVKVKHYDPGDVWSEWIE